MKMISRTSLATATLLGASFFGPAAVFGKPTAPATLADKVRHELVMQPRLTVFDSLSYRIDGSTVILSGQVTQPVLKDDVERSVRHIAGVTSVKDNIEVLPLSTFDNQIRFRTFRSLTTSAPLQKYFLGTMPSIRIIVDNGHVKLEGVVLNQADRTLAYMRAMSVPGAFSVDNHLQIESYVR